MKNKFLTGFVLFVIFNFGTAFAFEAVPTDQLLMSYLENDSDLKKNAIEAEKASLALDSAKITNGFDISLSTGSFTIKTDKDGASFTVKPSATATLPQASNLKVTASTVYDYKKTEPAVSDTKLSASVDLISASGLNRQITLMKAERTLEEATRKLKNQAVTTEKTFYTELKSLLTDTNSLISLEKTLYTDQKDFEKTKAQGYSSVSSTYRLAQMKVISDQHDIENSTRALKQSYEVFYKKCGYDVSFDENVDFYELVPKDITEVDPVDAKSFDENMYTEVESALWTYKIDSLQRKSTKNFTLSANGGFTVNNSTTNSNTVDAGLSSTIGGVALSAGVSVPVEKDAYPAITLSASLSPNTFRQNSITKKTQELDEEEELLAIETARSNYEKQISDWEKSLETLNWTIKTDRESYEMYSSLEKDLSNWYSQGLIAESDYFTAKVNTQSYYVKNIMNMLDMIIYNDNVITMFADTTVEAAE